MKQRGIIVGVNIDNIENFEELMIELENLCEACNIDVVGEVTQNSKKVNSTYYIGRGKVDELVAYVSSLEVDILIFNNELSTSQVKNIEGKVKCDVVHRAHLIAPYLVALLIVGGQENHDGIRVLGLYQLAQFKTVPVRQVDVQQH